MTTDTSLAFRGDPDLKASLVAEMAEHARQDRLIQGEYLDADGKGCAVGCTVYGRLIGRYGTPTAVDAAAHRVGWHETWAEVTGLPQWLGELEDDIFEGLTPADSKSWPLRLLAAPPVGVDLEPVRDLIVRDILHDAVRGVLPMLAAAFDAEGFHDAATALLAIPRDAAYDNIEIPATDPDVTPLAWYATAARDVLVGCLPKSGLRVDWVADAAAGMVDDQFPSGQRTDRWAWIADLVIHHLSNATAPVEVTA